jgi:predicted metal-dependent hydrolase
MNIITDIKIDKLIRSKRRTIALIISNDARLIIRAPHHASMDEINKFISKHQDWIEKKINIIKERNKNIKVREFVQGENFLYLGKEYSLDIGTYYEIYIEDSTLKFPSKFLKNPKRKLYLWYKEKAVEKFKERLDLYSELIGVKYEYLKINNAKHRWGSCNAKSGINLNWRLILAPLDILDYVIVHELIHIEEKNHKTKFWDKVKKFLPSYKYNVKWLKENGMKLNIF